MYAFIAPLACASQPLPTTPTTCNVPPARAQVARLLARDLPTQYTTPLAIDWSIYNRNVTFDDPLTKLSGLLMYKVRRRSFFDLLLLTATSRA